MAVKKVPLGFGSVSLFGLVVVVMSWAAPSTCAAVEPQAGSPKPADVVRGQPPSVETFRCAGQFGPNGTRAALTAAFGAQQVVTQEIFYGGDTKEVTALFPKDPTRRMFIEWRDPAKQQGIKRISIIGHSWSLEGLATGASLVKVEQVNRKPFVLTYFEGDFGGSVIDWRGGALEKLPGGCRAAVRFAIDENATPSDALDKEVSPERTLLSSGSALRKESPKILELGIEY
jgi:hypothetical protein